MFRRWRNQEQPPRPTPVAARPHRPGALDKQDLVPGLVIRVYRSGTYEDCRVEDAPTPTPPHRRATVRGSGFEVLLQLVGYDRLKRPRLSGRFHYYDLADLGVLPYCDQNNRTTWNTVVYVKRVPNRP